MFIQSHIRYLSQMLQVHCIKFQIWFSALIPDVKKTCLFNTSRVWIPLSLDLKPFLFKLLTIFTYASSVNLASRLRQLGLLKCCTSGVPSCTQAYRNGPADITWAMSSRVWTWLTRAFICRLDNSNAWSCLSMWFLYIIRVYRSGFWSRKQFIYKIKLLKQFTEVVISIQVWNQTVSIEWQI